MFRRLFPQARFARLALGWLLASGAAVDSAFPLDPRAPITRYAIDVLRQTDGLPHDTVMAVVQTRDGYLWLGTDSGLARFDGVRFTIFNKRSTPGIEDDEIQVLYEDRRGTLWAGTFGKGLIRYRDGEFSGLSVEHGLPSGAVFAIHEGRDGSLWIGTDGGLTRLHEGRLTNFSTADGLTQNAVRSIYENRDGSLWVGLKDGSLNRFRGGRFFAEPGWVSPKGRIVAIRGDRQGNVWFARDGGGLVQFHDGAFRVFGRAEGLPTSSLSTLYVDPNDAVWLGTHGGGLVRYHGGRFEVLGTRDGLSNDVVYSIAGDREGSLWVGTETGGLNRLKDASFTLYTSARGLSSSYVLSVSEDAGGRIWVATNQGLDRIDGDTVERESGEFRDTIVRSVLPSSDGSLWIARGRGLYRSKGGSSRLFTIQDGLPNDVVRVLFEDRKGVLWVGTEGGIARLHEGRFIAYGSREGLSDRPVRSICEDAHGAIWVGTRAGGLYRSSGNGFVAEKLERTLSTSVMALWWDETGALWIGTRSEGLFRLRDGKLTTFTARDGLLSDYIYSILPDPDGNLWLGSKHGVFRLRRTDLEAYAERRLATLVPDSYGPDNGMAATDFGGGTQPAAIRGRDGRLWFATINGLALIEPRDKAVNRQPPPVLIESVVADGTPIDARAKATLAPGRERVEFHYTGLSLVAPSKVRFRYMLEGSDPAWVEAGTRRSAYYTHLRPGSYRFRVLASNNDGVWNEAGASFDFYIQPFIYQTVSFYVFCGVFVALGGWGLYRLRVRALEANETRLEGQVRERTGELEREIAERVQFEEALREKQALLEKAQEVGEIGSWVSGILPGDPIVWSKETSRIFGLEERESRLTVDEFYARVHPDDLEKVHKASELALERGDVYAVEHRIVRPDGTVRWVSERARVLRDDAGRATRLLGVVGDITERKRLEEDLRQAHKMEAVGRLAGGVAHDFNNLLTAILGYTELLLEIEGDRDPVVGEGLQAIKISGERAATLTRQLLAFSRKQVLKPEVLGINEVVHSIEKILYRVIGEDIELETLLDPRAGWIQADRTQIEQVLLNLVVNARDAMPTGGKLTIETRRLDAGDGKLAEAPELQPQPHVLLAVSDTGAGIDESALPHIFEPFFTTKEQRKGTGLGLATVYGIVKQSGGAIRVTSAPGRGSTFEVYFALVDEQAESSGVPAPSPPRGAETVLVVEDEAEVRGLIRKILRQRGYEVLEASDGVEALAVCERHASPIHLVLTDVVMPQMDGRELVERLVDIRPGVKVLYVSGYTDDAIVRHGIVVDEINFLPKPFSPMSLARKVREVLDQPGLPAGAAARG